MMALKKLVDDEEVVAVREKNRRADVNPKRSLRMIEAVLTYVEANASDHVRVWRDEGEFSEFLNSYHRNTVWY